MYASFEELQRQKDSFYIAFNENLEVIAVSKTAPEIKMLIDIASETMPPSKVAITKCSYTGTAYLHDERQNSFMWRDLKAFSSVIDGTD